MDEDLESDVHAPAPAPYQPPGNPAPHPHRPITRNVDQPKQTPRPEFTKTVEGTEAPPPLPPVDGPAPHP